MKEKGKGVVVNVASIAGILAIGSSVAYIASKGALIAITRALARALGPEIRMNAICPGFIQGEWLKNGMGKDLYVAAKNHLEVTLPLRATGTLKKVAEAIFFFIRGADLVTGETLIFDGGQHLVNLM
jgi:3-oxoacyl-[acyl-carrier protein] reductase